METYDEAWVREHVASTTEIWHACASESPQPPRLYTSDQQEQHEQAYDHALHTVEADLQCKPATSSEQLNLQNRAIASFGLFAARALHLDDAGIQLLTREFLPVGTQLAHWARRFDPDLPMDEIIQAARNAWTACGLQPLLGKPVTLTPAIFGYSMLYPYSDNLLDDEKISAEDKRQFSHRFRLRLLGQPLPFSNHREQAIAQLIALIESQYPRGLFPAVFDCLLAIHQAQEQSLTQLHGRNGTHSDVLHLSCAKGGTSVLADACLARGSLAEIESQFAFEWGVLLQLGDDLQDLRDDLRRGSLTVFSQAVAADKPLDNLALQLLSFSEKVGHRMDCLPNATPTLKDLLKMSWRSLILRAIADSHEFFSPGFLLEAEQASSFRFSFLRNRSGRLASQQGLYATIFDHIVPDNAPNPAPSLCESRV